MHVSMVDIGKKKDVFRMAEAEGKIRLKPETAKLIKEGRIEKGDVIAVAQIAGILAAKKTPELVPLCHPIPITSISINVDVGGSFVKVKAVVKSIGKTGVEMEALTAVSASLLAVWDMCKQYEKDERGQYPETMIEEIRVISKSKAGG